MQIDCLLILHQPLHGLHRANAETVAAMDTMAMVDLTGNRIADAPLWTDAPTALTANTLTGIDVIASLADFFTTKSKTLAAGREMGEVEVFSLRFVDVEYFKDFPAFLGGIDFGHVGILLKNLRQSLLTDVPYSTPDGDRNR